MFGLNIWRFIAIGDPPSYMAVIMVRRLTALLALLWFGSIESAVAQQRSYPSLGRRAVESRDRDAELAKAAAELAAPAQPVAEDATLRSTVATLAVKATAAARDFDRQYGDGAKSVADARGASIGSEAWVVAERAISRLDAARYDSVTTLASLDSLYTEKAGSEDPARAAADVATIDRDRQPVLAMVDGQNDRLDTLKASLSQP